MTIRETLDLEFNLTELSRRRPVFHSKADFQFALATLIRQLYPELGVRLEVPIANRITLDMMLLEPSTSDRFAIELKYKTAMWTGQVLRESYSLRNHGADDIRSYDIVKDVVRVESLVSERLVSAGAVILLTNEPLYWRASAGIQDYERPRVQNSRRPDARRRAVLGTDHWGFKQGKRAALIPQRKLSHPLAGLLRHRRQPREVPSTRVSGYGNPAVKTRRPGREASDFAVTKVQSPQRVCQFS